MTALELQEDLANEVSEIVKDVQTKNWQGQLVSGVTTFRQKLPELVADEDNPSQFFHYAIIRLEDGETADDNDPWTVAMSVLFGIYDADVNNTGYKSVMEMVQRTIDHFTATPLLNKKFRAKQEISWALQEADPNTYPYSFGAVEIKFEVPKMPRKDDYA